MGMWTRGDLPDVNIYLEGRFSGKSITITDEIGIPVHVIDFMANNLIKLHKEVDLKDFLDSVHVLHANSKFGKEATYAGNPEGRSGCYLLDHKVIALIIDPLDADAKVVSHDYEYGYEYLGWEERLILIFGHEFCHFLQHNQLGDNVQKTKEEKEGQAYDYSLRILEAYREYLGRDENYWDNLENLLYLRRR